MILTSLSLPLWPSLSLSSLIYLTLLFPSFCVSITHISEWYRSYIKSRILPCHVILIRCDGGTFVAAGNLSLHHGPIAVMLAKQSHEVTKMCIWWYKFTILTHCLNIVFAIQGVLILPSSLSEENLVCLSASNSHQGQEFIFIFDCLFWFSLMIILNFTHMGHIIKLTRN